MSTSLTPPKKSTTMRHSNQSTAVKSTYLSPDRSSKFGSNVKEIPLDPQAHYTISYVPGLVEHEIDTGKTHEDAKMKIVLLTCELERVNTYNYTLVRENEVLRVQANKSDREKDLETKLAIVLAENEKLNQVIEEIYEVYMSQKGYSNNQEYELKITELYQDLESWKTKYNVLESQNNVVQLQNELKEIHNQKDLLAEQLARKDRDLEALRIRLHSLEQNSDHSGELAHKNAELTAENGALKKELDAMKLKYGKADSLQLKLADYDNRIKTVLAENEKLNDLVLAKNEEVKVLKAKLDAQTHSKNQKKDGDIRALLADNEKLNELLLSKSQEAEELRDQLDHMDNEIHLRISQEKQANEQAKRAAIPNKEAQNKIQELTRENEDLESQISTLRIQITSQNNNKDLETKIQKAVNENKKLTDLLSESERELRACREAAVQAKENKAALERLSLKIKELIAENETLNDMVLRADNKTGAEANALKDEVKRLKAALSEKQREVDELYVRFTDVHQGSLLVGEYKEKILILTNENEKLNDIIREKLHEIEDLKRTATSRSAHSEHYEERLRSLLAENQRLNDIVREQLREIDHLRHKADDSTQVSELLSKIVLISSENERLNNEVNLLKARLAEREREVDNLRHNHHVTIQSSLADSEREKEQIKRAGVNQQQRINDLEGRLSQLSVLESRINYFNIETEKLHHLILEKDALINTLNGKLAEKDHELDAIKKKTLGSDSQRQLELEELRIRLSSEQERKLLAIKEEMEGQIRRLVAEKREAEDKARYLEMELQRVQRLIGEIKAEVEEWKRRYLELESNKAGEEELAQIRAQFENLKYLSMEIKDLQNQFAGERIAYETQIHQLEQTASDLERENNILRTEIERVGKLSIQRLNTIEELKRSNNEDSHKLEVYQLRNQLELLKSGNNEVKELAVRYSSEKAADQAKINELIHLNANYKNDVEKLRSLIEQRKADIESLTAQNEELRNFCEKLTKKSQIISQSSNVSEIEQLETRISELEISRNEYKRQAERNAVDLTRKNRELVDKIQELDVLKLKYEEALANYQALNSQLFNRLSVSSSKRF